MICKVCTTATEPFATAQIRRKYKVQYFACPRCQFIQTEDPYWLGDAYADPINRSDVGYVSRNVSLAKITKALILSSFDANARFIDYGGGYGMFVRLLRDAGFDFYRRDKYCENLFAPDFEAEPAGRKQYGLLTSFEVFEHLSDPMSEIEQMLSYSPSIFFSTELQPHFKPSLSEWHYYALDHGQHISLYALQTLQEIARRFNLRLYSDGSFLHLLTNKSMPNWLFRTMVNRKVAGIINKLARMPSLAPADYEKVLRA